MTCHDAFTNHARQHHDLTGCREDGSCSEFSTHLILAYCNTAIHTVCELELSSVHVLWTNVNSVPNLGFLGSPSVNVGPMSHWAPLGPFSPHSRLGLCKSILTLFWTAIKHDNNRQCYNHFILLDDYWQLLKKLNNFKFSRLIVEEEINQWIVN